MSRLWVSTNLAISGDGKIASTHHRASGWTSREDHARLIELRRDADALLVGRGTWMTDRMTLTVPGDGTRAGHMPLRCVVSREGRFAPDHPLFKTPGGPVHLLVTGSRAGFPPEGACGQVVVHRQSLSEFLETLADLGVRRLHCEGGGELIGSLAEMDMIDEFHLTLAGHRMFGGADAPTATGISRRVFADGISFQLTAFHARPDLGECFLSYVRRR